MRAIIEIFKLYKTAVTILGLNLLLQDYSNLILPENTDFKIYRYAIVGLEILSFVIMWLSLKYVRQAIKVFGSCEIDLIRNNFTTDFYTKV